MISNATTKAVKVSLWIYVLFLIGIFGSALGPTLLDLKDFYHTSLLATADLYLVLGITEGAGCLGSMLVLKFLDSNLVLMVCMLLLGTSVFLFAMMPHINAAFVAVGVIGLVTACGLNCVVHQCNLTFPGNSAIMHFVFISSSVGGIVGPLIAEPFLGGRRGSNLDLPENETLQDGASPNQSQHVHDSVARIPNISSPSAWELFRGIPQTPSKTILANSTMNAEESHVHIIYIIIGSFHLLAFLGYCMLFISERYNALHQTSEVTSSDYNKVAAGKESNGRLKTIIFYVCLVSAYIPFSGLPFAYSGYLSVYGVEGSLHLSIQNMAIMTSVFWMMFTLGRVLGSILSLYIRQSVLIYICLIGVLVASLVVLFLNQFHEVWLWIGSMAIGLFSGPLLAASLSWCKTCVALTPFVIGMCTLGDVSGIYLLQYFTGQVIGHFGLYWYLYFVMFLSIFELMMFVILTVLGYTIQ